MTTDAPWISVRAIPSGDPAIVSAAFFAAGSQGVLEDANALVSHFPTEGEAQRAASAIREADPAAEIMMGIVPQIDWAVAWKDHVKAFNCGALTVAPPWLVNEADAAMTIVIEPGMAFGTGDHPTTRGVLRLMQRVVRAGDVMADLGAGSAVLAIGAAKLGAARIAAVEMDPEAIPDAEENVRRNGVADQVTVIEGDATILLPLLAPVQVILANIISSVLIALLPAMRDALAPGGTAILSGILMEEREHMRDVLHADGWVVTSEDAEGLWWSTTITRA
jgi:ribosomal protein L11 methyltransferase